MVVVDDDDGFVLPAIAASKKTAVLCVVGSQDHSSQGTRPMPASVLFGVCASTFSAIVFTFMCPSTVLVFFFFFSLHHLLPSFSSS